MSKLVRLLEDAAVVGPTRQQPLAALPAGLAAAKERGGRARVERSSQAAMLLLQALVELRPQKPELFSRRIEELHYLANVLIAGSSGRSPRPVEALEQAIAVCNTGLERALGADRALARAVELLETTPADQLFRRGYRDSLYRRRRDPFARHVSSGRDLP